MSNWTLVSFNEAPAPQIPNALLHIPYFESLLAFKVLPDSCNKIAALRYLRLMMNTVLSSITSPSPICCKCSSRLPA